MEERVERPLGVAILSVLDIIGGIILILGGLVLAFSPMFIAEMMGPNMGLTGVPFRLVTAMVAIFGVILLVMGLIAIIIGYFLWKGSDLARVIHIVLSGIGIIMGIFTLPSGIIGLIINIIIIYYLTRPHVKAFFY